MAKKRQHGGVFVWVETEKQNKSNSRHKVKKNNCFVETSISKNVSCYFCKKTLVTKQYSCPKCGLFFCDIMCWQMGLKNHNCKLVSPITDIKQRIILLFIALSLLAILQQMKVHNCWSTLTLSIQSQIFTLVLPLSSM